MSASASQIALALGDGRKAILEALTRVSQIHTYLADDGQEQGLDHVKRQLQNADLITMFMQRAWEQKAREPKP